MEQHSVDPVHSVWFWSAKGGQGCTTVAVATAVRCARHTSAYLVGHDDDAFAVLGMPSPCAPEHDVVEAFDGLRVSVVGDLNEASMTGEGDDAGWAQQAARDGSWLIVDGGATPPPSSWQGRSILVTTACYVALRRFMVVGHGADGAVLHHEEGRALGGQDVTAVTGLPILATVSHRPDVARCVDSGLIGSRMPRHLGDALDGLDLVTVPVR